MMISGFFRATVKGRLRVYLALATLFGTPLYAAENPAAATEMVAAVAVTIDAENLIELYQSVPDLRIVDARHREDYVLGHIELSRNLPKSQTDCGSLSRIAGDKDTAIVIYCNGTEGGASVKSLQIASACGYRRLFWLRGGFIEWQDKDYPYTFE